MFELFYDEADGGDPEPETGVEHEDEHQVHEFDVEQSSPDDGDGQQEVEEQVPGAEIHQHVLHTQNNRVCCQGCCPYVEHDEVAKILMANTRACEEAVMVTS